jgi:hypothetical protein
MREKLSRVVLVLLLGAATAGCVERVMQIRSDPPGAPVWLDEQYAGVTPLEHEFVHYGARRVRVGPIRDEQDRLLYGEVEEVHEVEAPWYETFPIDFFFEVLHPGRLRDEHVLPTFVLPRSRRLTREEAEASYSELRERAGDFRERAVLSIPEAGAAPER